MGYLILISYIDFYYVLLQYDVTHDSLYFRKKSSAC